MRLGQLHRSLTFRLALLYLLVLSASLGLLFSLAWWGGVKHPLDLLEDELAREAPLAEAAYRQGGLPALMRAMAARQDTPSWPYFAVLDRDGRLVAGHPVEEIRPYREGWLAAEFADHQARRDGDALARLVPLDSGLTLLVGRETEPFEDREEFLVEALGWSALIAPTLGLLVGLLTSLAVSRRIEAVAGAARRVMRGGLSARVEVRGTGDDFDHLAETLNLMLARIEELVQSVSRVSDHVAHELRTPLTRLRAELELLAGAGVTGAPATLRVERALAEATRLQATFDALLRIAQIEASRHDTPLKPLDLGRMLRDAAELYQPEAEAKGVRLVLEAPPSLTAYGDANLLFQALCNLLDNAVKFVGQGDEVRLHATAAEGRVTVAISDNGPGVGPEHRARVVERFYRGPNGAAAPGVGLGLPLVAAVCALHGSELVLEDAGPGFRARLSLLKSA